MAHRDAFNSTLLVQRTHHRHVTETTESHVFICFKGNSTASFSLFHRIVATVSNASACYELTPLRECVMASPPDLASSFIPLSVCATVVSGVGGRGWGGGVGEQGWALRQVHVCLLSTCHDIAWLHTPPRHPLPLVHPTSEDKYLEVKACCAFLFPNIFS